MRSLAVLAFALLALDAVLALDLISPGLVAVCPAASSSEERLCVNACSTDQDCAADTKCCANACGRACVRPVMAVLKAGNCPQRQAPLSSQPCLEKTECSGDDQCKDNKKCCVSRCAMRCMDPAPEDSLQ
ncbi:whey acidic protein-like isoform X2 [Choloepus didactylus]|uniref:whey acidic protein-like isoform X2 n=1 Tax=Choloepus didactylus TaxID=27675 RepID=UPI00189CAA05|nr:whey acidic protein-like isoform X2 [Choloepus didactylus]